MVKARWIIDCVLGTFILLPANAELSKVTDNINFFQHQTENSTTFEIEVDPVTVLSR